MTKGDVIKSLAFNFFFLASGWFVTELILRHQPGLEFAPQCKSSGINECNKNLFKNTPEVDQKILRIEKSFYRSYPYRSSGGGATRQEERGSARARWGVATRAHQYEMIKGEPRIGLNGMRRREFDQVDRFAQSVLAASSESTRSKQVEIVDMLRHDDPYHGVRYIVNYKPTGSSDDVTTSVEMERAYVTGKPVLKRMTSLGDDDVINLIMPISKVTSRFGKFIERLEHALKRNKSGRVRLVFVVFRPDDVTSHDDDVTLRRIEELRGRGLDVRWKVVGGKFNRARGIDIGVEMVGGDELMTFMDVDLTVTSQLFRTIRLNTRRGRTVFFPIVFSQYDPDIVKKAEELYPPLASGDKLGANGADWVSKSSGFWLHYAYGIVSIYKSDYRRVGGLKTDIEGWGGEDVDFFKRCVATSKDDDVMEVMTSVERDLVHVYHERGCDDAALQAEQYRMCIGAWSETLASQLQAGLLYRDVTN